MGWSGAPDFVVKLKITTFWILDFSIFRDDAAGGADNFSIWPDPHPIACRDQISRSGIPHFDEACPNKYDVRGLLSISTDC